MSVEIDQLQEAIDVVSDGPYLREMTRHNAEAFAAATAALVTAARAYRDLLANGERVEPDYEAAKLAAFDMGEQIAMARSQGQRFSLTEVNDMKVRAAVDAAIGDRLLVDPTTEEAIVCGCGKDVEEH